MFARACAARNGRATKRTAFKPHINFNGRIATRIQNLTRLNSFDAGSGHNCALIMRSLCAIRNPTLRI
jgi:hypothetical protein